MWCDKSFLTQPAATGKAQLPTVDSRDSKMLPSYSQMFKKSFNYFSENEKTGFGKVELNVDE